MIDCHTHYYPEEVSADPRAWALPRQESHWLSTVARGYPSGLQDWPTLGQWIERMEAAGLATAVCQGWYWQHPATCREQWAWYRTLLSRHPGRLAAFCPVQPRDGEAGLELVRQALAEGACGIGELHPGVQGFSLRESDIFHQLCALAATSRVPLCLHVTEAVGPDYPGRVETPLADYLWLARQFPQTTFIFAHWGGGLPFFHRMPRAAPLLANVYYDSAASPLLYDSRIWRTVADLAGADRILFGTDFPLRLFPRQKTSADFLTLIGEVRASGLSAVDQEKILGANARSLLTCLP